MAAGAVDLAIEVDVHVMGTNWSWEVRAFGHVPARGIALTRVAAIDAVVRAVEDLVGLA